MHADGGYRFIRRKSGHYKIQFTLYAKVMCTLSFITKWFGRKGLEKWITQARQPIHWHISNEGFTEAQITLHKSADIPRTFFPRPSLNNVSPPTSDPPLPPRRS